MREIALLLLTGLTTEEIATATGVTHPHVRNYRDKIYRRLGVENRMQLAAIITKEDYRTNG